MNNYIWYSNNRDIHSPDVIQHTLAYGSLGDIRELKECIGEEEVKKVFITYPKKLYTKSMFNFIKNYILHIDTTLDEDRYLKNTPRYIG